MAKDLNWLSESDVSIAVVGPRAENEDLINENLSGLLSLFSEPGA